MKYINYKEERNHGTIDFPIEFYHVTPNHPRYDMSYHWHIEYELIRVLKGKLLMSIGENEFTAEAGDLIFIKGGFFMAELLRIVSMNVLFLTLNRSWQ